MKKISILMLHLQHGGIEKQTISLANQLSKHYAVEIISFYSMNASPAYPVDAQVKIKYLLDGAPNREEFYDAVRRKNPFAILREGLKATRILYLKRHRMIREIRNLDCDYVLSTRIEYAQMLSKHCPKNVVAMTQEHLHDGGNRYVGRLRKAFSGLDSLLVLSGIAKENYSRWLSDNDAIKIIEIPNFLEAIPEESADLSGNRLVAAGRLHPVKNFEGLIDVFSLVHNELPDASLTIVGGGEEHERLIAHAAELGLEHCVTVTGMVSSDEVRQHMLSSDIYVMTSHTESFPMVLLEASSVGLPLVAYDVPAGPSSIIQDGINGCLVEYEDKEKMAEQIVSLLKNRAQLQQLGKTSKEMARNYSPEEVVPLWQQVFR